MSNYVVNYCEYPTLLRRPMWRIWHNLLNRFVKDNTVKFMNYGFEKLNGDRTIELEQKDEINRYCPQCKESVLNNRKDYGCAQWCSPSSAHTRNFCPKFKCSKDRFYGHII